MNSSEKPTLYFYRGQQLISELKGIESRYLFRTHAQPLAEQASGGGAKLLATDVHNTVLQVAIEEAPQAISYTPFGYTALRRALALLLGFNGEQRDLQLNAYILGRGYRSFIPRLMRFSSPDSLSPFGKGGINAYAYCMGDPVNYADPSGHAPTPILPPGKALVPRVAAARKRAGSTSQPQSIDRRSTGTRRRALSESGTAGHAGQRSSSQLTSASTTATAEGTPPLEYDMTAAYGLNMSISEKINMGMAEGHNNPLNFNYDKFTDALAVAAIKKKYPLLPGNSYWKRVVEGVSLEAALEVRLKTIRGNARLRYERRTVEEVQLIN